MRIPAQWPDLRKDTAARGHNDVRDELASIRGVGDRTMEVDVGAPLPSLRPLPVTPRRSLPLTS